jgi:steroid delta-isomerase-like uncharacterized protein
MAVEVRSTDANKALVRRAIGYNHGVPEEPTELFAPDFVAYLPGQPPMDRAMLERFMAGFGLGFPGHTIEIQDQIARGDIVVNRTTVRGVHDGEFAGVPATGRPIEVSAIVMFKLKDGRVVEQRAELDFLGLLQQIGAIPPA